MEIRANEITIVPAICLNCFTEISNGFVLTIGKRLYFDFCFDCVVELRDLCHEATCEKDVTGKCDCWEGER
jgi:hypothetical protein